MSAGPRAHRIPTVRPTRSPAPADPRPRGPLAPRSIRGQAVAELGARFSGVATEPDLFNILILNYTMKCPLACDYCCYHCSPTREETMDLALALDLVDQAAELGVFSQCGFTGGEALVWYDDVLRLGARMQSHGLPFSMISACDWARTPADAERVIGDLVRLGMCVFTATHDASHENWVPKQYVSNALDAVLAHGIRACLCSSFYDDSLRLETLFPQYVGNPDVDYVNRVVLPEVGRSSRRAISPASYPNVESGGSLGACYKRIYHDVTVFWDGEVYPCCSVYNRSTPRIGVGNVYRETLATIWDRVEGSLWLRTIKRHGFAGLYDAIRAADPELAARLPDPAQAVGPCHLCHRVFRDAATVERLFEVFDRLERERIAELLALVEATGGADQRRRVVESTLVQGAASDAATIAG